MSTTIKYLEYLIYYCLLAIPFFMAIAPAPMNVFMGLAIAGFILKKVLKRDLAFAKSAVNLPLLLLLLITCFSLFKSVNYLDTLKGGIFRLLQYIFIFHILLEELKQPWQIRNIVFSMALGVVLVSLDGVWQVFSGTDFIRGYYPIVNIGLMRATASFKDANTFGIYLSAITPLIIGLTLYYYKQKQKITAAFIAFVALLGVVLTYSRPTLLAVYLSAFFLAFIKKDKATIAFMIILTVAAPFIVPKSVKGWARQVNYNPIRFMCNDDRIAIFRNSWNMLKNNPVIGVGANTFMKNYKKYKESPEYMNIVTSDTLYAHNNFLHMAAEIGLVGLSIFIWMLYGLFKQGWGIYKRLSDSYLKLVALSLLACLLSFLVNGLTESSLYSSRVAMIFWYLAGFTLSLGKFIPIKPVN